MTDRRLILVKHAKPLVDPAVPTEQWVLSDGGRRQCGPLADRLSPHAPAVVIGSEEPKAAETARLVAVRLGVPYATAPELHEHDRGNVPHMPTREFISSVELFFRRPTDLVLGRETAAAALSRFESAVDEVLHAHPAGNVAVVAHGTVIALFVAKHNAANAFHLWRRMGLPSFVALRVPGYAQIELIDRVPDAASMPS